MTMFDFSWVQRAGAAPPARCVTPAAVAADVECTAPAQIGVLPASVPVLLTALANHDGHTYVHSLRVAQTAWILADAQGHAAPACRWVYLAGLLHDVGKIYLPRTVLRDEHTLTCAEHDLVCTQAARGAQLLEQHHDVATLAPVVAAQYERPDGWGMPHGLRTSEIPAAAAFVAVAEALDAAMYPHGMARSPALERVRDLLLGGAGWRWDAAIAATAAHLVVHRTPPLPGTRAQEYVGDQLLVA